MEIKFALDAFASLSQETRLKTFRLLVEHGREGAAAGLLSESLSVPHNTLSFHLSQLTHAGLVTSERQGRSIIYKADLEAMNKLIAFMTENCCARETEFKEC